MRQRDALKHLQDQLAKAKAEQDQAFTMYSTAKAKVEMIEDFVKQFGTDAAPAAAPTTRRRRRQTTHDAADLGEAARG